jgi:aryl sulfotransferase
MSGVPPAATEIVWLASYLKAGNTWVRLLLMHLLNPAAESWTPDQPIGTTAGTPIHRSQAEELCHLDASLLSPEESDLLRPLLYEALIQSVPGRLVLKTHDAFRRNRDGRPVLSARVPQKALYLVRDPRDVAVSLAAFWNRSIERTVAFMNRPDASLAGLPGAFNKQLYQQLHDWSGHVRSWLDQQDLAVLVVRYEELRAAPVACLERIAGFLKIPATPPDLERAVRLTDFARLQRAEERHGFLEHSRSSAPFFRRAQPGEWREALPANLQLSLEQAHGACMQRLGYACESVMPGLEGTAVLAGWQCRDVG